MEEKSPACPSSSPQRRMKTGSIGPTMVVAMPLKMKPTNRTANSPVRLPEVRSGIAIAVVAMSQNILKERAAGGNYGLQARRYAA